MQFGSGECLSEADAAGRVYICVRAGLKLHIRTGWQHTCVCTQYTVAARVISLRSCVLIFFVFNTPEFVRLSRCGRVTLC